MNREGEDAPNRNKGHNGEMKKSGNNRLVGAPRHHHRLKPFTQGESKAQEPFCMQNLYSAIGAAELCATLALSTQVLRGCSFSGKVLAYCAVSFLEVLSESGGATVVSTYKLDRCMRSRRVCGLRSVVHRTVVSSERCRLV